MCAWEAALLHYFLFFQKKGGILSIFFDMEWSNVV